MVPPARPYAGRAAPAGRPLVEAEIGYLTWRLTSSMTKEVCRLLSSVPLK